MHVSKSQKLLRTFTVHFIPYLPRLTLLLILSPETMSTVLIQCNYHTQLLYSICTGYYRISLRLNSLTMTSLAKVLGLGLGRSFVSLCFLELFQQYNVLWGYGFNQDSFHAYMSCKKVQKM